MPVVRKTSHQGPVDALPQSKSSVQTSHRDVTKLLAVFLCMLGRQVPTCLPKAPPGNITEEDYRLPSKGQKKPSSWILSEYEFGEKMHNSFSNCKNFSELYTEY